MDVLGHWIGGEPVDDDAARTGDVYDPAAGHVQRRVALASAETVGHAVARAREAWVDGWRESTLTQRARVLFAFRELVASHLDELASLIVSEHGKVHADAAGEVQRGLEVVEFACGIPHLLKGSFSESVSTDVDTYSVRQPVGVAAGITPFNFPAMVPMWMFPLAIACGNAFVLKPSERDPSVSLRLAELWRQAGTARGGLLHRQRGPRGRRRAADPPGRRRGLLRRLHAGGTARVPDRDGARQAGAGARRREEPHGGAPRRRPRSRRRRGGVGRLRFGR
jgi:acyl-CoA reductase-like NAD-dependent aldehyde dehydrogenase